MVRTEAAATAATATAAASGGVDIDQVTPNRGVWVQKEAKAGRTKLDDQNIGSFLSHGERDLRVGVRSTNPFSAQQEEVSVRPRNEDHVLVIARGAGGGAAAAAAAAARGRGGHSAAAPEHAGRRRRRARRGGKGAWREKWG